MDPCERAVARVKADQEYQRVAMDNLRRDRLSHLAQTPGARRLRAVGRRDSVPLQRDQPMSPTIIRVCWAIQALLFLAACAGAFMLFRRGQVAPSLILCAPILYITAVHFWLLTEARQSLPAQPVLLMLAAFGIAVID